MKKFILLTSMLLACTSQTPTDLETITDPLPELINSIDPQLCIDHLGDPTLRVDAEAFRIEDSSGIGQFSFTGTVKQAETEAPFSGEPMMAVYLEVPNDESDAYRYFYTQADGTVDDISEEGLLLKLGILEGWALSSSAYLDPKSQAAIMTALESGKKLTLTMLAAAQVGHGMSANEVNPCLIVAEEL